MEQKDLFSLIQSFTGQSTMLTVPRIMVTLMDDDLWAAFFLSQCIYWQPKTKREDGYFYKSNTDWYDCLGIKRGVLDRVVKICKDRGYIDVIIRRANGSPHRHFRVIEGKLIEDLMALERKQIAEKATRRLDADRSKYQRGLPNYDGLAE